MKKRIILSLLLLSVQLLGTMKAQVYDLPRSTPEEQGVPSKAIITVWLLQIRIFIVLSL